METNVKRTFKIVLIGDGAVGKTSLRKNYMGESFEEEYLMTIGADFAVKYIPYEDYTVGLQIWDLAGQPRFSDVRKSYYAGAYGAIVVFDITRPVTFQNTDFWINELIKNNNNLLVPMILIGNKVDLRGATPKEVQVSKITAAAYAETLSEWGGFKVPYIETSAKTGQNVQRAFDHLIDVILSRLEVD